MILALVMLTFIGQIMEESILQISSGLEIMDNTRLFLLIDLIALLSFLSEEVIMIILGDKTILTITILMLNMISLELFIISGRELSQRSREIIQGLEIVVFGSQKVIDSTII